MEPKKSIAEEILMHYGIKKRSGRYPWGSGNNPYQRTGDFLSRVEQLRKEEVTFTDKDGKKYTGEVAIARHLGLSTTELRLRERVAKHERRQLEADRARALREDGLSLNEIARQMGYKNDSSVRSLLDMGTADRKNKARQTADILKEEIKNKKMIDVGRGAERQLGVSQNTLKEALFILESEGYKVYPIGIPQVTQTRQQSNTAVLCLPDIQHKDVYKNMGDIREVTEHHSTDSGKTFQKLQYPASVDSERIMVRYGDEGGTAKDGVIELRRGVDDLNLGNSHYAQVRILVDNDRYLKGMAIYSDDLPDGVDIVYNVNKKKGEVSKLDTMKPIKTDDPENPFGAYIKAKGQSTYFDKNGKEQLSAINKLKEEGDWDTMSKSLSSQFLSKQPMELIRKQLNLTYADAEATLDDIKSLTNPTVKQKMLLDFADSCDGAVIHLKSAALPRQKVQVILPVSELKDNEVYAPNYKNGEKVALVRYPHGGIFEIPILTVNNKHKKAKEILGPATDAIGINPNVAERLSGADFDGDDVVVIPTNDRVRIQSQPALKGLKGFNPSDAYPPTDISKRMPKGSVQREMGIISNLITDMTLKGATEDKLARAVRHSMVVIDAEKHKLDYKKSERDNGIAALKKEYQGYLDDTGKEIGGASTLLSRRKQNLSVPERRGSGVIDPDTGKVTYKESGRTYIDPKTGKEVQALTRSKLLLETEDVRTLSSGTRQENAYADYANKMKALANTARKEYKATPNLVYSKSAFETYRTEVDQLNAQVRVAEMNAPKERRANAIANSRIKAIIQDNPELKNDKKTVKKLTQQAINDARAEVGASGRDSRVTITDRQWEAIQAGAVSHTNLTKILRYSDSEEIKKRATPKQTSTLSQAQINKIKHMLNTGYTYSEVADALKVSTSTISAYRS